MKPHQLTQLIGSEQHDHLNQFLTGIRTRDVALINRCGITRFRYDYADNLIPAGNATRHLVYRGQPMVAHLDRVVHDPNPGPDARGTVWAILQPDDPPQTITLPIIKFDARWIYLPHVRIVEWLVGNTPTITYPKHPRWTRVEGDNFSQPPLFTWADLTDPVVIAILTTRKWWRHRKERKKKAGSTRRGIPNPDEY